MTDDSHYRCRCVVLPLSELEERRAREERLRSCLIAELRSLLEYCTRMGYVETAKMFRRRLRDLRGEEPEA